jgi:hypothetical protein
MIKRLFYCSCFYTKVLAIKLRAWSRLVAMTASMACVISSVYFVFKSVLQCLKFFIMIYFGLIAVLYTQICWNIYRSVFSHSPLSPRIKEKLFS